MTFWETIERGEYVMFALAVILIVIVCIWWIRGARLRKDRKSCAPLMQRVRDHVVEGDIENARQLCEIAGSPGALVVETGLSLVGKPMSEVIEAMRGKAEIEKSEITKGCRWLRVFAVISPLLGLGGTLIGIIDRLRDLGENDAMVDTALVCNSIAPTIVTTVAGLGVGIFSLIALAALDSAVARSSRSLDEISADFSRLLNEPS